MLTVLVLTALVISPGIQWVDQRAPWAGVRLLDHEPLRVRSAPHLLLPDDKARGAPGLRWVIDDPLRVEPDSPGLRPVTEDAAPRLDRAARLLEQERTDLEQTRPRILLPVLLTTGGLAAALGGLGFIWAGLFTAAYYAFSFAVGSVVLLSIGIVLVAAGIPLATVGAVKLHRARQQRRKIDQRLERLDHEAAQMQKVLSF